MPKGRRSKKYDNDDAELPVTAGAFGDEKPRKRRRRQPKDTDSNKQADNVPSAANVLPPETRAPAAAAGNLAGIPDRLSRTPTGTKTRLSKTATPVNPNHERQTFIHFMLQTGALEWVHFPKNSISAVVLSMSRNPNYNAAAPDGDANRIEFNVHQRGNPAQMIDPDVGGRGFFSRVEVIINDQMVPTNDSLHQLFGQYARYQAIFQRDFSGEKLPKPHFKNLSEWVFPAAPAVLSPLMNRATDMFAHRGQDDREGERIEIPMDGVFPFDLKSELHSAVEGVPAQELFFPPSTKFEVKLYYQPTKMEYIFHQLVNAGNYYTDAAIAAPHEMRIALHQLTMEYVSVELHPQSHIDEMKKFRGDKEGYYEYDIPRGQYQTIPAGASYTENTFQINPYCRSLLIAFHPARSVTYQPHLRRPLCGWSTFPPGCTRIQVEYAQESLLGYAFTNFGVAGTHSDVSMRQYYNYLQKLNLTSNFSYEDLFPRSAEAAQRSLVQYLAFDCRHLILDKIQLLKVAMDFSNDAQSPDDYQIVVVSIHPNGRANVTNLSPHGIEWHWEFLQQH